MYLGMVYIHVCSRGAGAIPLTQRQEKLRAFVVQYRM